MGDSVLDSSGNLYIEKNSSVGMITTGTTTSGLIHEYINNNYYKDMLSRYGKYAYGAESTIEKFLLKIGFKKKPVTNNISLKLNLTITLDKSRMNIADDDFTKYMDNVVNDAKKKLEEKLTTYKILANLINKNK